MDRSISQDKVVDARNDLEHALFHLAHVNDGVELRSGTDSARRALRHLREATLDCVYASTCAEQVAEQPGNLRVGVTAHCACGRSFADDVVCGFEHPGMEAIERRNSGADRG